MKKWFAFLLILCLLSGCTARPTPDASVPETSLSIETTEASVPEPPEFSLITHAPFIDSSQHLQEIPLSGLSGVAESWYLFQNHLLIASFPDGFRSELDLDPFRYQLTLLDLITGEITAKQVFSFEEMPSLQICEDSIALSDWSTGVVRILDADLKLVQQQQFSTQDGWNIQYVDWKAENVYTFSSQDTLEKISLATGEKAEILADALEVTITSSRQDGLALTYVDRDTMQYRNCFLSYSTGTILPMPFPHGYPFTEYVNGLWLVNQYDGDRNTHFFGSDADPLTWTGDGSSFFLTDGPAPLYSLTYNPEDTLCLRFYNADGTLSSRLSCSYELGYLDNPQWHAASGGYFITAQKEDGSTRLLYWKPQAAAPEHLPAKRLSSVKPELPRDEFPQELYDRADALSREYGVQILLGSQCGTHFSTFSARPEMNPDAVQSALESLETALSSYPKGFTRQLIYGSYQCTRIHLVGSVEPDSIPADANGFTTFAAFVLNTDTVHEMVLDVNTYDLVQTIYHEFSHIIDDKLEFHAHYGDGIYSEYQWEEMNPEDFSYSESIYSFSDSYYHDGYDAYFIDTYARTHSTEDRARIMEYAMVGDNFYFDYAPLREKLAYYSACIRDVFHTEGWPEVTQWELPLDGYTFSPLENAA